MVQFIIIEDQQMMGEMLTEYICKTMPGVHSAGNALTAEEGIALCRKVRPDLVLIDIHMPDADGIETARELNQKLPETHVVLISGDCSPYNCYRIAESGIRGFVDKTRPLPELNEALSAILKGKTWFAPSFEKNRREYNKSPTAFYKILSNREQQVLLRVACGDSDDEIARHLNISRRTAETHRYNISKKLNLGDAATLRKYAIQQGMWHPDT